MKRLLLILCLCVSCGAAIPLILTTLQGLQLFEDDATAPTEFKDTIEPFTSLVLQAQDLDESILNGLDVVIHQGLDELFGDHVIRLNTEEIFQDFGELYYDYVDSQLPLNLEQQALLAEHIQRAIDAFKDGDPLAKCCL